MSYTFVVIGHEVRQVAEKHKVVGGQEVTFPPAWVVLTRLMAWEDAAAVAAGTEKVRLGAYTTSKMLEHFQKGPEDEEDGAVEALRASEEFQGGAGVAWTGQAHRVSDSPLRFPQQDDGVREGFVSGHCCVLWQREYVVKGKKRTTYGPQIAGYIAVNVGGQIFHVRMTSPGQFPVRFDDPERIEDLMSSIYWTLRDPDPEVGAAFGTPVSFSREGMDYKLWTPPPPPPPSWVLPPKPENSLRP